MISTREYREGDEYGIIELLNIVFEKWRSGLKYWKWLYEKNPAGRPVIWVAEDGNSIVGHYAIFPVKMKLGENSIMGSQSVDTAVRSEFRRQGILKMLARRVYETGGKKGMLLTYGFTAVQKPAYRGLTHTLDWRHVCLMKSMIYVVNFENVTKEYLTSNRIVLKLTGPLFSLLARAAEFRRNLSFRGECCRISKVPFFDERVNPLWTNVSKQYDLIVVRDKAYLNWRYVENPSNYTIYIADGKESLLGYVVLRETIEDGLRRGTIVDIIAYHDKVFENLIQRAIEFFKEKNVDFVQCWLMPNHRYCKILRHMGFIAWRSRQALIVRANPPEASGAPILPTDSSRWFITYGDSDHI